MAGLEHLLNAGYIPVLAHVERYDRLDTGSRGIRELRENGVLIQIDIQSLFGGFGWTIKRRARSILSRRQADLVATDAHDLTGRPPGLANGYRFLAEKYGQHYADAVCWGNAQKILYSNAGEEKGNGGRL